MLLSSSARMTKIPDSPDCLGLQVLYIKMVGETGL